MSQISTWSTRQIIVTTIITLFVGATFWLLLKVGWLLFTFFIAIVMGTALKPATDWFRRRGLSQTWSILVVYLLLLFILISLLVLLLPPLVEQITLLAAEIPAYYTWFRNVLLNSSNLLLQQLSWQLPPNLSVGPLAASTTIETTETVTERFTSLNFFLKGTFMTIATLMLSFYWILDGQRALQTLYFLVPIRQRDGVRDLVKAVEAKVGAYVRGQIILCFIVGIMALVAYLLIGLPNALALALFAGIMEIVPFLGPAIGAIPAIILAMSISFETVIWVIVASVIIQQLENAVVLPRIMDKSVGVHPFVTLLAFFTLGSVLGVLGAILAVPIAAIIQLLIDRFNFESGPTELESLTSRDEVGLLKYEMQVLVNDIRKQARQVNTNPAEDKYLEDELESIANELARVLAQSGPSEATR